MQEEAIKTWENKDPKDGGKIIAANNKTLLNKTQSLLLK